MIDFYSFGKIIVDGKKYNSDLIITPKSIISPWWRKEGHFLIKEDLDKILTDKIDYLIIGTGHSGMMRISENLKEFLNNQSIPYFIGPTGEAVAKFNEALKDNKKVFGAFHLTC